MTEQPNPWQPIETAPKDGTHFIAARFGHRSWPPTSCCWGTDYGGEVGWVDVYEDGVDVLDPYGPTHWMPIPDPPFQQP